MERPYIFCHMMTSLDGHITGNFMDTPEADLAGDAFYQLAFGKDAYYKHQGRLSGRVTSDENFTFYRKPDLREGEEVPEGDFIINQDKAPYYISIDPKGKLSREENTLDYGDTHAQVLEVLSKKASKEYRAFLRRLEIPYIICGKDDLEYEEVLEKLYKFFGIRLLMLGGGGVLNRTFVKAGLCDELSLVLAPVADGDSKKAGLFTAVEGLSDTDPVGFNLEEVKVLDGGGLWIRYKKK